jgi:uncharacterized FlaG/YvyC family protein
MDVQAAASAATILPPGLAQTVVPQPGSNPAGSAATGTVSSAAATAPAAVTAVASPDTGSGGSSNGNGTAGSNASTNPLIGPTPGLATLPASSTDAKKNAPADPTLASGVAKLFNSQEQNISVSFQIEQDPNEIVTVFTDKQTGKVIVQFPSETLIALAKFFDKLDGNVINKKV